MNLHPCFLFALVLTQSPLLAQTSPLASTAKPPVLPGARVTVLVDNLAGSGPLLGEWGAAFRNPEGKVPDLILDDQALCFRVPEGVVVVLGCGHAGLVNTLEHGPGRLPHRLSRPL